MSGSIKVTFGRHRYAMGVPSRVILLHSCAEVRAAIEVSGVTPDIHVLDGGLRASSGRDEFWVGLPPLAQWFQCLVTVLIVCGPI